ncbi:MAG: PVC-type heme-binding CxxCH protein, partial [Chthoniobacteraceae bacterium]
MKPLLSFLLVVLFTATAVAADDANRLTYLDDASPFWPGPDAAKLTTPQWIGEPGVEAVVILAIDDMRDPAKYEAFLRPILNRLQRIDGRAPVSIMTNTVPADDPQLQAWLKEGVSIENHTLTHPCPLFGKAGFDDAALTYHGGVDLLARIPHNHPVAFRMPCCDSMNSLSPRFFPELFNHPSPRGNWLAIDSSVFTLPPGEQFAKYFPAELRPPSKVSLAEYAGFIADYPYPFVIGRLCWEFPCMVPSDWEAFNVLGPKSPTMLEDWKAALDHVVEKQGVFTAVFHPHGWSAPEQWVAFIDYAESKFGSRVKFLTFPEALARLEKHSLDGHSLRRTAGGDAGARLLDVNADGFMDVVIGTEDHRVTRVWHPTENRWSESETPAPVAAVNFAVLRADRVSMLTATTAWTFTDGAWQPDAALTEGLNQIPSRGRQFRDFDRDGICELLADRDIFAWKDERWQPAGFALPDGCAVLDSAGRDNGLRFVDLNGDGFDDVFQSNDSGYVISLWAANVREDLGWKRGWPHLVARGAPSERLMPFVKSGQNNGAWFHRQHVVWQNEDTFPLEAHTLRRSFTDVIAFDIPPPKSPAEALAAMRPRPGFDVQLVAGEPLVVDPVAFDWDAEGRLWVAEMRDYPLGMDGKGQAGGVVKVLDDEDRDGRYDRATVFLEDLPFPTGVMPWRDGVLVIAVPDIIFARDTDGDGRADERRVLFTGFKLGNQQHRANGFALGLDGWVYGANGDSGGTINGVNISGRDFRFRPDTGEFEAVSGNGQYGRRRDDFGNWFANNNSTWLWHYTIEDRYLRRNPKLAVKRTKQVLANDPDPTRVFTAYPPDTAPIRFNQPQSLGRVTSACSPTPYRDTLFGPDFASSIFICEPV